MRLEDMYQEVILDHYRAPHGKGLVDPYDAQVHHVNPTCGDEITLRVRMAGDKSGDPIVESVSFDGQGCSISQAAASVMHDQVAGMPLSQAMASVDEFGALMRSATEPRAFDDDLLGDGIAFEGVAKYPARIKCALLSWMAFKDAASQATSTNSAT
jgi:nitrogen fixation protein NifU and related proteins